jgi:enoyl-CoA hydratase
MKLAYENLLLEQKDAYAIVTLNRPKVMNALNRALFTELNDIFTSLATDAALRAVILTGAGEKAFAAGADISELATLSAIEGQQLARRGQNVFRKIETCGKPVIAAINGFALGGGCELAMACTLRIAGERARLGQPEVKLGLVPAEVLMSRAEDLARAIAQQAPLALSACLRAVDSGYDLPLDAGLELEASLFGLACATEDKAEGTRAFLEKRTPVWQGR